MARRTSGGGVAVYLRVSTRDQTVDSQRQVIERWLESSGIDAAAVTWFVDEGATGDNLDRPAFVRLQEAIRRRQVRTVACYKLDRLSRSLRDGINLLTSWLDAGVRVVAVTQQLDFAGATGQLVAAVLLAVAQMEQETRRERQAAGIAVAKERGKYQGRKPGTTKADPDRLRTLLDRGMSVTEAAAVLGVSRRSVYRYQQTTAAVS